MKFTHFILASTAIAACVLFPFTASAQEANSATVTSVSGKATYAHGGGAFGNLSTGTKLGPGDVVKTGPGSRVNLQIGNNVGFVGITPNSTFGIDTLLSTRTAAENVTDSQFNLQQGAIFAQVNKQAAASRYEIKTPRGIAGIRGTSIYLTADGELTVEKGTAGITYTATLQTFVLHDGETIREGMTAPGPADPNILREILEWLRGLGGPSAPVTTFVPPQETFISPVQPSFK